MLYVLAYRLHSVNIRKCSMSSKEAKKILLISQHFCKNRINNFWNQRKILHFMLPNILKFFVLVYNVGIL